MTHTCNTQKKWCLKKTVDETSQTNILVLYRVSSIYHSLLNIHIYVYIYYVILYYLLLFYIYYIYRALPRNFDKMMF